MLAFDIRMCMCMHILFVSRLVVDRLSCRAKEEKQQQRLPSSANKQKAKSILSISSSLNPMLPSGYHAVAIVRKHPTCSQAFPSLALRQNDFGFPRRRQQTCACVLITGIICWCKYSQPTRTTTSYRLSFGGLERKDGKRKKDTQTLTGENLLL